jgi:hypothetical protein
MHRIRIPSLSSVNFLNVEEHSRKLVWTLHQPNVPNLPKIDLYVFRQIAMWMSINEPTNETPKW